MTRDSIPMASRVSNPIREARRNLHLTRDQLGNLLGVAGRTVSSWETGERRLDPGFGPKLKAALGLSDGEIWRAVNYRHRKAIVIPRKRMPLW